MTTTSDDELRARFRALAREESSVAPAFSRERLHSTVSGAKQKRRVRRIWYSAGGIAAISAAAALTFIVWPRNPPYPIDLSSTGWTAPTDFLLDTPGSALLRTVPSIGAGITTQPTNAASDRGDTSRRDEP